MPNGTRMNERDTKLVQWLNEAHAKEAELEADLNAHIALTEKQSYKKRLRKHLTETKDHKRRVASRIKQLGGAAITGPLPSLPGVPTAVGEAAGKAVAAVKGQVGTARAVVTNQAETHLRNAQEELREEHVEIAIYSRIQTFAEAVGDRESAQLAKSIKRDEERMAKFLDAELARLVKEVVRAEVPRGQRPTTTRRRRRGTTSRSSKRSGSTRRSTSSSRSRGSSSSRSAASRSSGRSSGSRSTPRSSGSKRSTSRTAGSSRSTSRSSGSRRSTSRSSGSSRSTSRSSGSRATSDSSSSRSSGSRSGSTRSRS